MTSLEKAERLVATDDCSSFGCEEGEVCPGFRTKDCIDACRAYIAEHKNTSKLTIQRPEGCPDWVQFGVMVMVRDADYKEWEGPYSLYTYYSNSEHTFGVNLGLNETRLYRFARPYIKWKPEPGEWCAFWDDLFDFSIERFNRMEGSRFGTDRSRCYNHCARLVDDDGKLIDVRCTADDLKGMTAWL